MKILYIHQYFKTPEEGGCTRSYHLAKGLVENGHEVEMITAHDYKRHIEHIEGINVRYLPIPYSNYFGFFKRIYAFYRFVKLAIQESKKIEKIDLAYVMTTPLSTGFIALNLKKKRNIPYIFEVGDLWPEAPIQMGVVKNRLLKSLLYRFEKKCYFEANKVIALSPDIRNHIEKVPPMTKVYVIPNIAHCNYYNPQIALKRFTSEKPFRVGYIGTLGKANNLETLIEVASESETNQLPIVFHIMGEGGEETKIKRLALKQLNIIFHPFGSKERVKELLVAMDAVYVSFKNVPVLQTGSPNKFFDGLAAGKLVIINFKGWIKTVVESNSCGFYHSPENPKQFIQKIKRYLSDQALLIEAQKNSRKVAEEYYDRSLLVKKLCKIIDNEKSIPLDDSEIYILTA